MKDCIHFSVQKLSELIKARELNVSELVAAFIQRIENVNPLLNALVHPQFETARHQALEADRRLKQKQFVPPALFGIPFTVKDVYAVSNCIITCGTQGLAKTICKEDATSIRRLLQQGAILLGISNTPEMGVSLETDNLVYGRTNHPLHVDYSTGGSSGGEAALIASYASPMGIAGDHGGGARYPAHCCGVMTLRPSLGLVPQTGSLVPKRGWVALTSRIAPMARHAKDLQLILDAIRGGDGLDPYAERPIPFRQMIDQAAPLRIAYLIDAHPPETDAAIFDAMEGVYKILSQIVDISCVKTSLFEEGIGIAKKLFQADAGQSLKKTLSSLNTHHYSHALESWLAEQPSKPLSLESYFKLWSDWDAYKIKFLALFSQYDAVFCPVAPQCALPHNQTLARGVVWSLIRYTASMTLTECPIVVLPCGSNAQGLPIGIQIITKPWQDELLLSIAELLENTLQPLRNSWIS